MRPTYAVVLPVPKDQQGVIDSHTERGRWRLVTLAPRGLAFEYVRRAVEDILDVRIVPLSNLRGYGLHVSSKSRSLPVCRNSSEWLLLQERESRELREYIQEKALDTGQMLFTIGEN